MSRRRSSDGPEGILLIDKETGWTSHDVVAKLRGVTGQRRTGHTGTLDPAATGLLVVCLGRATRLVEYMMAHDKAYEGEIRLGTATDTDDAEGQVVREHAVPPIDDDVIAQIKERFLGAIEQVPPAYSAIKVDGQRAYAAARKGTALALEARTVHIDELELRVVAADRLAIRVECGPGMYVRSLARDIGEVLGCGGHLARLRRTHAGAVDVAEAATIGEVEARAGRGKLGSLLRAMDEGVMEHDAIVLGGDRAAALGRGERLRAVMEPWEPAEDARVYGLDGRFHGIARVSEGGAIVPVKMLGAEPGTTTVSPRRDAALPSRWGEENRS